MITSQSLRSSLAQGIILLLLSLVTVSKAEDPKRELAASGLEIVCFEHSDAVRLLRNHLYTNAVVTRVYRDSQGAKLFIQFYVKPGSEQNYRTAVVSTNGLRVVSCPVAGIFDDQQELVYWKNDRVYYFRTAGEPVKIPAPANGILYIQSDPSREYLAILDPVTQHWNITRSISPQGKLIELPAGFELRSFFVRSNAFVAFGKVQQGKTYIQKCLVYGQNPLDHALRDEIQMPWAGTIFDFDPVSGYVKVDGRSDFLTTAYLFNVVTKEKKSFGLKAGGAFFLISGLAVKLQEELRGQSANQ
jgi:hypothetical protein